MSLLIQLVRAYRFSSSMELTVYQLRRSLPTITRKSIGSLARSFQTSRRCTSHYPITDWYFELVNICKYDMYRLV
ncbi:hypothetical protein F383_32341 [Gossypium arboreum]|uniref:Uncharacterized protein n=1 Tax=Gossypium arboreum TaxID=29729 RepID=A0A0B0PPV2_GOSAR|nr:hypothetical protein F383_32341 [Gossypium arboreum]